MRHMARIFSSSGIFILKKGTQKFNIFSIQIKILGIKHILYSCWEQEAGWRHHGNFRAGFCYIVLDTLGAKLLQKIYEVSPHMLL